VISAYNEEGNIPHLYAQLAQKLEGFNYEIIIVNDGSRDGTLDISIEFAREDFRVKVVNLTRNFGHEVAMTAGMDYSKGDAVVFMDADLQHPPEYVVQMIKLWEEGYEVVFTRRIYKKISLKRKLVNYIFYTLYNFFSDIPIEHNAPDFRLISRKHIERIKLVTQKDRMFKGLINFVGVSKHTFIDFEAPERFAGETKYTFFSLFSLALNGILQFSTRPLRIITFLGVIFTVLSLCLAGYTVFEHFYYHKLSTGFATIVTLLCVFFAFQTVFISVLGEYIGRIHLEVKDRPLYFSDFIDYETIIKNEKN
jgi:dolichol-phosphate mannosyltransferase